MTNGWLVCEPYVMVVSWIAISLSVISLALSIYVTIRDRPRLGIVTRNDVNIGGEPTYTWHVTVINYGRQPQAISDVGLVGKEPAFSTRVFTLLQEGVANGPDLPEVIKPYSSLNWTVQHEAMLRRFPNSGQEFRSYVVKYNPVFRNKWLEKVAEKKRSHGGRAIRVVSQYEHGYKQMPER